jgi:hypothetical protein
VAVDQYRYTPILRGVNRILYRFLTSLARLAVRSALVVPKTSRSSSYATNTPCYAATDGSSPPDTLLR